MRKAIAIAAMSVFMGLGCKHSKEPMATAPAPAAPMIAKDTTGRVIVHIVSRHETITVKSGPHGVLYSIHGADGAMTLADATPAEFEQADPQLFRQIRGYIAVEADATDAIPAADMSPIPWASIADR